MDTLSLTYSEAAVQDAVVATLLHLPKRHSYRVYSNPIEGVRAVSCTGGNGSVRHYKFRTYQEALDHGMAWGRRKIAEASR